MILALDTSGQAASAAIADRDKILSEFTIHADKTHSETMMPLIENMFKITEIDKKDIKYIACSKGPGSFTGLRIGASIAKGIAKGLSIPIIPISTLDMLAYNGLGNSLICPIMDARRSEVYTAVYKNDGSRLIKKTEEMAIPILKLIEIINELGEPVLFLGDGVYSNRNILEQNIKNSGFANTNNLYQRAASLASLAYFNIDKQVSCDIFSLSYLRKPQAERELLEKSGGC